MTNSIDQLRRKARTLKKAFEAGDKYAHQRVASHLARASGTALKEADYLDVIAQENNFENWPNLIRAAGTLGLGRAARIQRLKIALFHGQHWKVERLLTETPDLAADQFGLACALYHKTAVATAIEADSGIATRLIGPRRPMLHLTYSKHIHARPELKDDMLAIAQMLVDHGADVNDSIPFAPEKKHRLSALYGAIGHAGNMALGRWLLEHGANPNDGESLYHATELGHHEGLKMLLAYGADPKGTNALLRAMDFHDVEAVRMLLEAGAMADEFDSTPVGAEYHWVVPALHQAARRMCGPQMIELLLGAGADPMRVFDGQTPYAYARIFGNTDLSTALEARGCAAPVSGQAALLARLADGEVPDGTFVDPEKLPEGCRNIIRLILHLPGKLPHVKRLIEAGMEYDRPDTEGLTPVQLAGWEGRPEVMEYLLSLGPDLSHVNGYGGTLLTTIIHGSENNPDRENRDYIGCLSLALEAGCTLPRRAPELAGEAVISAFLADWAEAHPEQAAGGGPA